MKSQILAIVALLGLVGCDDGSAGVMEPETVPTRSARTITVTEATSATFTFVVTGTVFTSDSATSVATSLAVVSQTATGTTTATVLVTGPAVATATRTAYITQIVATGMTQTVLSSVAVTTATTTSGINCDIPNKLSAWYYVRVTGSLTCPPQNGETPVSISDIDCSKPVDEFARQARTSAFLSYTCCVRVKEGGVIGDMKCSNAPTTPSYKLNIALCSEAGRFIGWGCNLPPDAR